MRKSIVFIIFSLALVKQSAAQKTFFGIKAGISYVQIRTSVDVSMNPTIGEGIGLSLLTVRKNNWETVFDIGFEKYHYEGYTRVTAFPTKSPNASIDAKSVLANFSIYQFLDEKKHFKFGIGIWASSISNDYKYPAFPLHYWTAPNAPSLASLNFYTDYLFVSDLIFLSDLGPSFDAVYQFNDAFQLGIKYRVGFKNQYKENYGATWSQNYLNLNFTYYFGRTQEKSIFKNKPSENFKKNNS